jgi:hypothetical protein
LFPIFLAGALAAGISFAAAQGGGGGGGGGGGEPPKVGDANAPGALKKSMPKQKAAKKPAKKKSDTM